MSKMQCVRYTEVFSYFVMCCSVLAELLCENALHCSLMAFQQLCWLSLQQHASNDALLLLCFSVLAILVGWMYGTSYCSLQWTSVAVYWPYCTVLAVRCGILP
jgi:hypothetical protein